MLQCGCIYKYIKMKIPFTNLVVGLAEKTENNKFNDGGRSVPFSEVFKSNKKTTEYKISLHSLFGIYRNNSDVRNCVREIKNNVGKSGYKYIDATDPEAEVKPSTKDEIWGVFNSQESTHKTFKDLIDRTVRDLKIAGNAYWLKLKNDQGVVLGFQPIDPRTMAIVANDSGHVFLFVQKVLGHEALEFLPDDVIHFKGEDDPLNEVFGLGELEPVIWEARTDNSAMIANFKFFENNAIPSALYILDEKIPTEKLRAKFDEIKKHFGSASNYKKVGAIVGVKDIKTINMSQKDMDFLAGRTFSTKKICASFGVPVFLLGDTDKVNNNNGEELEKNFMEKTIIPLEQRIETTINSQFMFPEYGAIGLVFNAHVFSNARELEERAMNLYKGGMKTLRQAKKMIGDEITDEDEQEENFDKYIIQNGASSVLLEDVGVDPELDIDEE